LRFRRALAIRDKQALLAATLLLFGISLITLAALLSSRQMGREMPTYFSLEYHYSRPVCCFGNIDDLAKLRAGVMAY
jgi:hypothetical protein